MACLLQLPHNRGFAKAEKLTALIPEYESWADLDPLCIRLQMALGAQDYDKALEIINDIGIRACCFKAKQFKKFQHV